MVLHHSRVLIRKTSEIFIKRIKKLGKGQYPPPSLNVKCAKIIPLPRKKGGGDIPLENGILPRIRLVAQKL